jgi:hypothetical protein
MSKRFIVSEIKSDLEQPGWAYLQMEDESIDYLSPATWGGIFSLSIAQYVHFRVTSQKLGLIGLSLPPAYIAHMQHSRTCRLKRINECIEYVWFVYMYGWTDRVPFCG